MAVTFDIGIEDCSKLPLEVLRGHAGASLHVSGMCANQSGEFETSRYGPSPRM
jgi:hypothetical protein